MASVKSANLSPHPNHKTSEYSANNGSPQRQEIVSTVNASAVIDQELTSASEITLEIYFGITKNPITQSISKTTTVKRSAISACERFAKVSIFWIRDVIGEPKRINIVSTTIKHTIDALNAKANCSIGLSLLTSLFVIIKPP